MRLTMLICVVISIAAASSAHAGWDDCWHQAKIDYYRNKCWPEPFIYADRNAYWTPFAMMTANGWRNQNTLGDHHFHRETHRLNRAGEEMVRWILHQAPEQHRTIYVLRTPHTEQSSTRLDSVQRAVVKALPEGELPEVVYTQIRPRTSSGTWTDNIGQRYQSSMPAPVLQSSGGQ